MIAETEGRAKEKQNAKGIINKAEFYSFLRTCILQCLEGSWLRYMIES